MGIVSDSLRTFSFSTLLVVGILSVLLAVFFLLLLLLAFFFGLELSVRVIDG